MMQDDLIAKLHASPWRGVLAVTGGGAGAIARLLATPGASATVLEAVVPYSARSLAAWLGRTPERSCDEATAQALAMRAFERALELDPSDPAALFGVGCTASLASTRPKRGEHRAHVAVQTAEKTHLLTVRFEKGRRSRGEEEDAVTHAVLAALADTAALHTIEVEKSPPGVAATIDRAAGGAERAALLLGQGGVVGVNDAPQSGESPVCLLPGSFNPPHQGHAEIVRIAGERTGRPVVLELSITNVDKPPLSFLEQRDRLAALAGEPVWLTRAPTFVEKARLSPGGVFAVGADTAQRIGAGRYYGGPAERDAAMAELSRLGCRFLVFGRLVGDRFEGLDDLDLPPAFRALCDGVPESEFRCDVSSTELRKESC